MGTEETAVVRVKGGSIRSKLVFVRDTFGEEAEQEFVDLLEEHGVGVVLEASWYDYKLFDRILRAIADRHFGGKLAGLRAVGRFSARYALNTTYQAFLNARDIHGFLRRLARLHSRYYDQGKLILAQKQQTRYEITLIGQPVYYETDMQVAAGFYAGAAEMMSCRDVSCQAQILTGRVVFDLHWVE
ncbi:MAG: hypothetical protein MPN21_17145 [Thermoanaerobaculia bacterium]|nr:hypothetical protein [Thermoanaerobaculia bacterium]